MFSVVIPVYKNEASLQRLLEALTGLHQKMSGEMEVVFVVDGSPDQSFAMLNQAIHTLPFPCQLLAHSRNFGSFPAIRTGLMAARGEYFGVMAADLQEPPELMLNFQMALGHNECDVAIGTRTTRSDPFASRVSSNLFWWMYRRLIMPEMPEGGIDVFGCNRSFRDQLLKLEEARSSLIALIFWLGFRRKQISYQREQRQEGRSGWTLRKKLDYMLDSIFAFTEYPIRLLLNIGMVGSLFSIMLSIIVFIAHQSGKITVPGYAATILVVLFFGMLNLLGLGLVGTYAWRSYENSKRRPLAIVSISTQNNKLTSPT